MEIRLNDALDLTALQAGFQANGRLQVHDVLAAETAERIAQCLEKETPWQVAYNDDGDTVVRPLGDISRMTERRQRELLQKIYTNARENFQFIYNIYPMTDAYMAERDPDLLLHRVFEFINSDAVLGLVRTITGIDSIIKGDAQATRYVHQQFLTRHNDQVGGEHRRLAYVFNFTRSWQPDWGGYLQFYDQAGNIADGFLPTFNTLNIFRVPADHSVSMVTPFAGAVRYAITGWFMDA